jgi:hypothetical protein
VQSKKLEASEPGGTMMQPQSELEKLETTGELMVSLLLKGEQGGV